MWKMAWRNLWRNRTRTAITITAIALTYSLYIMMVGIQEFMYGGMQESAAKAAGGMVLVQADGYQDDQLNTQVMRDVAPLVDALHNAPAVEHVSTRVILNGLLSTSASALPARILGVDPVAEREFQDLTEYLRDGTLLEGDEEESPIVLGSKIVRDLELELGDRVILSINSTDGELQRALFHLTGVLHTNSEFTDGMLALTTIDAARRAVRDETILTQIGVIGDGTSDQLADVVRGLTAEHDALEVLTWQEAMPDLVGFIEMDRAYGDVMALVIFLVVWFSIMNTFLMVVMERVRELGLVGALGMTPRRIAALVLTETFLLATVALAVGLVVGVAGHLAIDHVGIDTTALYGTDEVDLGGIAMADTVIHSTLSAGRIANITLSVLVMVLLGAIYPAIKAMRMQPAEAMRFYE